MKLYGGYTGGKLHWYEIDDGFGGRNWRMSPALFRGRQEALCQFEDVRPVEIVTWEARKQFRPKRSKRKP